MDYHKDWQACYVAALEVVGDQLTGSPSDIARRVKSQTYIQAIAKGHSMADAQIITLLANYFNECPTGAIILALADEMSQWLPIEFPKMQWDLRIDQDSQTAIARFQQNQIVLEIERSQWAYWGHAKVGDSIISRRFYSVQEAKHGLRTMLRQLVKLLKQEELKMTSQTK